MQADKTTLGDLSLFTHDEEHSVFHHLNFTRTVGGKQWLHYFLINPFDNIHKITETQNVLRRMLEVHAHWSNTLISNGTIMVMEKFYETSIQEIPSHPNFISSLFYRAFNSSDFSLLKYSLKHFVDFVIGLDEIVRLLSSEDNPSLLQTPLERIKMLLNRPALQTLLTMGKTKDLSMQEILSNGHFIRRHFKPEALELIDIYGKLDAYYSLATACKQFKFSFPSFIDSKQPIVFAKQLYHPLIPLPVAYDISLSPEKNFLFLTGANMGGKSTFIKATGVAIYLAHIGMGVPAQEMQLSLFDGLLSNINVVDNIIQGESYFYNEVQRIRKTIEKISDGKKWLILIDELFKGTNVQDAMKCSTVVIEGLRKMSNALFILSTHLYEIGESLKQYPNIQFRYFETEVRGDELIFSYQLKEGISNDRLGYLILKREKVVELLEKL